MRLFYAFFVLVFFVACKNDSLKFEDLPKDEQNKYILKSDLDDFSKYISASSDEIEINAEPISGDEEELKDKILNLRAISQQLFADNVELTNKNLELLYKIKKLENEANLDTANNSDLGDFRKIQDELKSKISEQNERIAELEKNNVQNVNLYEQQIIDLQNKIDMFESSDISAQSQMAQIIKNEKAKFAPIGEENKLLKFQVQTLKNNLNSVYVDLSKQIQNKDAQNANLRNEIYQKDKQMSDILVSHANEIVNIQNQNSKTIGKFEQELNSLKKQNQQNIDEKNQQISELKSQVSALLKMQNSDDSQIINAKNTQKSIDEKKFAHLEEIYKKQLLEQNQTIAELNGKILALKSEFDREIKTKNASFAKALDDFKKRTINIENNATQAKFKDEINKLNLDLKNSQNALNLANLELKKLKNPDNKTIKNYEILEEKITNLNAEIFNLKDQIFKQTATHKEQIQKIQTQEKNKLDEQKKYYETMINSYQKNISTKEQK